MKNFRNIPINNIKGNEEKLSVTVRYDLEPLSSTTSTTVRRERERERERERDAINFQLEKGRKYVMLDLRNFINQITDCEASIIVNRFKMPSTLPSTFPGFELVRGSPSFPYSGSICTTSGRITPNLHYRAPLSQWRTCLNAVACQIQPAGRNSCHNNHQKSNQQYH